MIVRDGARPVFVKWGRPTREVVYSRDFAWRWWHVYRGEGYIALYLGRLRIECPDWRRAS